MGLLSFVKSAGEKLFGKKEEEEVAVAHTGATQDTLRAKLIERFVVKHNLSVSQLNVQINGDTVTVSGEADNNETREKVGLICGNIEGIEAVTNHISVAVEQEESRYHAVVSGDTLSKIAKTMYGDAMKYPVIFEANKPMLAHPDKIYPGQLLRIPAVVA